MEATNTDLPSKVAEAALTEERQERLLQQLIETPTGERIRMKCGTADLRSVITDFLSLLDGDSQAAGDAQRLAFAIESAAVKAGIIDARQHALIGPQLLMLCDDLANATTNAATAMRDKCVDKLHQVRDNHLVSNNEHYEKGFNAALKCAELAMRSLTLDQVKPGEM